MKTHISFFKRTLVVCMVVLTCFGPGFAFAIPQPPQPPQPPAAPSAPQFQKSQTTSAEAPVLTSPTQTAPVSDQTSATPQLVLDTATGNNSALSGSSNEPGVNSTETDTGAVSGGTASPSQDALANQNNKGSSNNSGTTISNNNNSNVVNDVVAGSTSGDNKSNDNTGSGGVISGASDFVMNFINMINSNFITLPGGTMTITFKDIYNGLFGDYIIDPFTGERYSMTGARMDDVTNSSTGAGSKNTASVENENNLNVNNQNNTSLVNNFDLSSNTGNNKANENTGDGSVTTGDSNLSFNLMNFINSNFTVGVSGLIGVINIFGDWTGNLVIPKELLAGILDAGVRNVSVSNANTGHDSTNKARLTEENNVNVENTNAADVTNNITASANTGNNEADENTGGGNVTSGNSSIATNVSSDINKNIFGDTLLDIVVNVMGTWGGLNLLSSTIPTAATTSNGATTISLSNANTGAGSTNIANSELENNTNINNTNGAQVSNNIKTSANTGNNDSSENTGSGSVTTGNAKLAVNIANFINTNVTANRLVYLVINVFGNWKGNITDTPTAQAATSVESTSSGSTQTGATENVVREYNWSNFRAITSVSSTDPNFKVAIENITDNPNQNQKIVLGATDFTFGSPDGTTAGGESFLEFITSNLSKVFLAILFLYILTTVIYLISSRRKDLKGRRIL